MVVAATYEEVEYIFNNFIVPYRHSIRFNRKYCYLVADDTIYDDEKYGLSITKHEFNNSIVEYKICIDLYYILIIKKNGIVVFNSELDG